MLSQETHLSDQQLLQVVDGELSSHDAARVEAHLAACWDCRVRKQEIETAIGDFIRVHRRISDRQIPPPDGPRALLKAQLAQLAERQSQSWLYWVRPMFWQRSWTLLAIACGLGVVAYVMSYQWYARPRGQVSVSVPNAALTPGATVLMSQSEVCRSTNINNKMVPVALQRIVFHEYGIPAAEPTAYEVDYLITPALGGADDIHNLWPQSSRGTVWNSQVKDELEEHLRQMVCDGQLDLATAQRDIAGNWIEAYKKYFHTDRPATNSRP
jgi:hypothetical protein